MNDDNMVSFELPQPSSARATAAADAMHLQATLAARLDHVGGLMHDLALLCAREDVTADELTLIDQIVTQLEHVLYQGVAD